MSYPRWWVKNRWHDFAMRNDGWEYKIYKEIKGEHLVKRIIDLAVEALRGHVNFYLEEANATYIRVYGSKEAPYRLSRYASDKLILMEFCR